MSTFKHPVGPQPSKVYWRRRLLVALGVLAVIVVIILIVVRPGSSSGAPVSNPTKTPSAAVRNSTSIPTSATRASGQPCKAADVAVKAITDTQNYPAGQKPKLSVSITNHGTTACKINAGTSQQVFTITSGSEVYWKSSDCQTEKLDAEVLLQPGKAISSQAPITWDRTRSDPTTCSGQRTAVPAAGASYHLQVSVAGIASDTTTQFSLN